MAGILRNFQPALKNVFLKIKKMCSQAEDELHQLFTDSQAEDELHQLFTDSQAKGELHQLFTDSQAEDGNSLSDLWLEEADERLIIHVE